MSAHLQHAYRGGYEGRSGWWLEFSYDEEVIERLKTEVPSRERTWDATRSAWWVSDEAIDLVLIIIPALAAHLNQKSLF